MLRRLLCSLLLLQSFTLIQFAAPLPLVNSSDDWWIHKGTNAPQTDWKVVADGDLNPAIWSTAPGGFGYSTDNPGELVDCATVLSDMQNRYTTLYLRKSFELTTAPAANQHLFLQMDWDDGFIAWLDGNYLTSMLVTSAPSEPANTAPASANHESSHGNSGNNPQPEMTFDLGPVGTRLSAGIHTLAIIGLNVSSGSSDFVQVARLFVDAAPVVPTNTISGTIASDTTLYASNSPYSVSGTVTVGPGATLTIEPGTELQMLSSANLVVSTSGRLLAQGTADQPIRIKRPTPNAANWGGITVNGGAGSPESRFEYAEIEGNSALCINVNRGTVYLDHVRFGTARQYLSLDGASFVITDCYFPGSTTSFEPIHGTLGIKAGGRGIVRRCYFGPITGYSDTIDFTGANRPSPILQVINNVFAGTGDDNLDLDSTDAWVQDNIFLHIHKNGSPDTSSAVSGGDDLGNNGNATIIGNIFYDCDQAVMAKQGNFYTLINNTVVRQTHQGGLDTEGAVLCVQDNNMTEGLGMYLEANIMYQVEKLTRNRTNAIVTFQDNLMPLPWAGPGTGNSTAAPMLMHIPALSETYFTNWADAQIMKQWFSLQADSPARATGPMGLDKGAIIPFGVCLSGEPIGITAETSATLTVGINRQGNSIPLDDWPNGAGYTHYKWRLDGNPWSTETPISVPIVIANLAQGLHYVEVIGKNDAGYYQNDPEFGPDAVVTRSRTWYVGPAHPEFSIRSIRSGGGNVVLSFDALGGTSYSVQWVPALGGEWQTLTNIIGLVNGGDVSVTDFAAPVGSRFYRIVTPAQ